MEEEVKRRQVAEKKAKENEYRVNEHVVDQCWEKANHNFPR